MCTSFISTDAVNVLKQIMLVVGVCIGHCVVGYHHLALM